MTEKNLIFSTAHGSHLYGLAHEGSDMDEYRVYETGPPRMRHEVIDGVDTVSASLFLLVERAQSGSHQSLEALFSPKKIWAEGMREKWGSYVESFRITGPDVFEKYERTIRKFCYGDFKLRRHAIRLKLNLSDLRKSGRFNPEMPRWQAVYANGVARLFEGDDLVRVLFGGVNEQD